MLLSSGLLILIPTKVALGYSIMGVWIGGWMMKRPGKAAIVGLMMANMMKKTWKQYGRLGSNFYDK